MSHVLLATKFFAPPRPAQDVPRPQLLQVLDDGLSRKLTLVCAAAGFGKSTLLGQWTRDCPYPSAWLSLDAAQTDVHGFLAYLLGALQEISPSVGAGVAALLQGTPPAAAETVLTLLLNQLSGLAGKLILVLDDYHLAASPPVNAALAFLLDHLPAQLHLVLASRELPDVPLGRLRAQGQLTEIRQEQLRFGVEEAAAFFDQCRVQGLSAQQLQALEARTEGWIAGLKLAALSLQHHAQPGAFIDSFTGSHRFVQDYLMEEVLQQQTPAVQQFLLRTAVLDRLCGGLCDAVLQSQGGQARLEQLEQAQLFIVPLDAERRWFRYHHLFADLLRQRLLQQEPPQPLHARASQWYEAQGLEVQAFHQATAAEDIPAALRLLEGDGMPLYFRDVTAPVVQWLASLPPAALDQQPLLWVAYAWSLLFAGQPAALQEKLQGAEAAWRKAPHTQTPQAQGQVAALWAWRAVYQNDADTIHAQARQALQLLPPDSRAARTAAQCALGVAHLFRGERDQASAAFAQVIQAGDSSGNLMFTAVATTALAGIQAAHYQLHQAAASYRDVLQRLADPTHLLGFEARLGLARILYDWNALDEAEPHALLCSALAARPEHQAEWGADLLRARLLFAGGEHPAAEALLTRGHVDASGPLSGRAQEAAELRVLQLLRRGALPQAAALARAHQLPLGLPRVLLAQGQAQQALQLIEAHGASRAAQGLVQEALQAKVLQALAQQALGATGRAQQLLREALLQAQPQGSVRLFVDEGAPLHTLLRTLPRDADLAPYIARLLHALDAPASTGPAAPAEARRSTVPMETFSPRELEILRLIQAGHSNQHIGERLFLSLSTVKWHNQNLFAKLDVQRRTEAVARALELKLL